MLKIDDEARKFLLEKVDGNLAVRVFFGGFG
jgi:DNA polymerase III delta subunit